VDDDAVSLEIMALLLSHEGHQVVRANDAGAALQLLAADKAGRPDVMLVDLQMPGVSGRQLAESIRAMEGPGPLLLAMSATEARRQQLLAFDGFLLKPLALDDLRQALKAKNRGHRPGIHVSHPGRAAKVSSQIADMAVIEKLLTMMSPQALEDVVAACIADTRACVKVLEGQLADDAVRQYAHRIKGAAAMIGANRLAKLAASLETGSNKEAATRAVLGDLLKACNELERMLLAGKLQKTRAPHYESTDRDNTVST
jgi:CheY-like chemotaxis protein